MVSRLIIYLISLVLTVYFSIAYLEPLPTIIFSVELAVGFLLALYVIIIPWGIKILYKKNNKTVTVGDKCKLSFFVSNKNIIPLFYGEIVLNLSYAQISEKKKVVVPFSSLYKKDEYVQLFINLKYAGTLNVSSLYIKFYDPLKIFCIRKKIKHSDISISILPQIQEMTVCDKSSKYLTPFYEIRSDSDNEENLIKFYTDRKGDDPSEVFQIRDYVDGDKLSRVDWKLSAKSDSLIVKDYSCPIIDRTFVFFDIGCKSQLEFHERIHTVVSLCVSLIEAKCTVMLGWYDTSKDVFNTRHIEKYDDLYESLELCLRASLCQNVGIADILSKMDNSYVFQQIVFVTGKIEDIFLSYLVQQEIANMAYILAISKSDLKTEKISERLTSIYLPEDNLEKSLSQISLEFY